MALNIVLLEPEIPANTGNIGRSCVASGARLHLIEPLGFSLEEKHLRRAGLDYWPRLDWTLYRDFADFLEKNPGGRKYYLTTKARRRYTDAAFRDGDYLVFGRETAGLPEELLVAHEEDCLRIPMAKDERALNLSNSVAIVLYEALRQMDFAGLESEGALHRLSWKTGSAAFQTNDFCK